MSLLRTLFLAASGNAWLRDQATRRSFIRRSVSRFMPGETLDDALRAARTLREQGITTIVTCLGENVTDRSEADAVAEHYLEALDRIAAEGLDAEISVKLTQLGLDLAPEMACRHLSRIAEKARALGNRVWVDMEGSAYTGRTIEMYRMVQDRVPDLGVCLQAYLRRTPADLEHLLPSGPHVRVVKGAYQEPESIAWTDKREVDERFFALAVRLLEPGARAARAWLAAATHDPRLVARLQRHAREHGIAATEFEFAMLYGIRRAEQARLAREGWRVRVLISYGSYWFPWYMRRLAERPANVWFVLRSLFGG